MSRRAAVLFAAMCLIWGIPYLLIKIAVDDLAPTTLVLSRTAVATVLLLPIAVARGQLSGLRAAWPTLVVYTLVEICGPFLLIAYAETRLSSSLTGLLVAAVPMVGAVIARFSGDHERLGRQRALGLVVGLVGVATLVGVDVGGAQLPAVLAMAGVAVGYAVGPVILARRLSHLPQLGVVTASLAIATAVFLPVGLAQAPSQLPPADAVVAVVILGVVCTAVAFLVFFRLIAEIGAARATVITYVNPAVAVILGVLLLDEAFTASIAVGSMLVLAGSVLATGRGSRTADAAPAEGPAPALERPGGADPPGRS